jgi:glycosyltransferase involved in cell wall biosynthesis
MPRKSDFTTMNWDRAAELIESHTVEVKGSELCRAPVVSVILHTYQHAAFIRQAIDSILAQECSFDFEIIVGDDGSTDGNYEILLEYQKLHPGKIVLLQTRPRLGRDGGYGTLNLYRSLRACRGEYFALLEGDDYWTHPGKLQIQHDLLKAHPECSGSYHDVEIVGEWNDEPIFVDYGDKRFISFEDQLTFHTAMAVGSLFARRSLFHDLPDAFLNAPFLDRYFIAQMAFHGPIIRALGTMGAYRRHQGGITSGGLLSSYDGTYRTWEFHQALKAYFSPRADGYYDYLTRFTFYCMLRITKRSLHSPSIILRTLNAARIMGISQILTLIREIRGAPNPYALNSQKS